MSITTRITRPWLSWLGLAALVIGGIALVVGVFYPIFGSAGREPVITGLSARYTGDVPPPEMRAPSAEVAQQAPPSAIAYETAAPQESSRPGVAWAASVNRMVIYSANVSLETTSIEKQHKAIAGIARKAGGFITASGVQNADGTSEGEITLRVPQQQYATVLDEICKLGRLISKREEGQDVTEEYVDLQSRLRNLKREEEAFLTVLGKASRITDILAVERELSRVRGEIETAEGRTKYLKNQIELSTITVSLSEPQTVVTNIVRWDIWNTGKAAVNSLSGVFRGVTSLIVWLVIFIPLWAVFGIVVYGVRRHMRRGRPA